MRKLEIRNYLASFYGCCNSIKRERDFQDKKWGEQNHNDLKWFVILSEEVGEVAKTLLNRLDEGHPNYLRNEELIQVAAVCIAWMECLARKGEGAKEWEETNCPLPKVEEKNKIAEVIK